MIFGIVHTSSPVEAPFQNQALTWCLPRYVGILHEINSENSTVALEQVVSFGTEGRRGDPAKEIPATDNVYEYIVFRGSDVKDLRIEEQAKPQQPKPPQMPDDPAILQVCDLLFFSTLHSFYVLFMMKNFGCIFIA